MTKAERDELRKVASRVRSWKWITSGQLDHFGLMTIYAHTNDGKYEVASSLNPEDALFVEMFNPNTALEMLDTIDELERVIEEKQKSRKIVNYFAVQDGPYNSNVHVLYDDGTLWRLSNFGLGWTQVKDPDKKALEK